MSHSTSTILKCKGDVGFGACLTVSSTDCYTCFCLFNHNPDVSLMSNSRQDPLVCECFQKLFVFGITKLCLLGGYEAIGWIAVILFAASFGILMASPYGTESRNKLAAACYTALSLTALLLVPARWVSERRWILCLPTACLALFVLHLQVMPGDMTLVTARLLQKIERTLPLADKEEKELDVEEVLWEKIDWPGQWLIGAYRNFFRKATVYQRVSFSDVISTEDRAQGP